MTGRTDHRPAASPPDDSPSQAGSCDWIPQPRQGDQSAEHAVMRARLAAMARSRDEDDAETAALRAVLRDQRLMAHVIATVEQWPPLDEQQQEAVAALLNPARPRHNRR